MKTGEDPNPHHLHVFDWDKLANGLGRHFILEAKYIQSAPGGFKLPASPRVLEKVCSDDAPDTEWLLAVASANPFAADEGLIAGYQHPEFRAGRAAVVDLAGAYDNPFFYRTLIQMGERLTDDQKLIRLALLVTEESRPGSAERGGAIAVLGYRVLEGRSLDDVTKVIKLIQDYATADAQANVHTLRWRLSHAFLAGRLMELAGESDAAITWYRKTAEYDWRLFSPLLATKTVGAAFYEGRLHLQAGDEAAARTCFERGVSEALAAAQRPSAEVLGDCASPHPVRHAGAGPKSSTWVRSARPPCGTSPSGDGAPGLFAKQWIPGASGLSPGPRTWRRRTAGSPPPDRARRRRSATSAPKPR
jgi:hypothetical protein